MNFGPGLSAKAKTATLAAGLGLAMAAGVSSASTTPLYAGGVTLSGKAYRNIFNVYSNTASGDLCVGLAQCPATAYRSDVEILYLSVTSTNTLKALDADNPSLFVFGNKVPQVPPVGSTRDFGPFYGTGTGAGWVPSGTATNYFPKVSFTSGDPLAQADVNEINALGFGPAIQVPSLSYSVVITFNPPAPPGTWTPKNPIPSAGSSGVNFSTTDWCGIFTGAITDWSDPAFKAGNKNQQLGSGAITVVYRNDGAATTYLLANAMLNQCGSSTYPVSTHPVPEQWLIDAGVTDKNGAAVTATSDAGPPYLGNTSFFIKVFNAKHLPENFFNQPGFSGPGFAGSTGGVVTIGGMQAAVDATPGSVGYLSSDYAPPVATGVDVKGNPISDAANLQSYASFAAGTTPHYFPPSYLHTRFIMLTSSPPSTAGGAAAPALSAINWSLFNPTPTNVNAYPIGGFAYFNLYSCYSSAADVDALVGTKAGALGLIRWYFGTPSENNSTPSTTLADEGFAPAPTSWIAAAKNLLFTNILSRVGTPGKANTACAKVTKGA